MKCPKCDSTEARRSRHSKWKDVFHSPLGQQAYRCRSCHARFYAPKPAEPPAAASASTSDTSQKRHHKSKSRSKSRRRHLVEAGVFALMMIIFIFCLLFITRQRTSGEGSNSISGSFNV